MGDESDIVGTCQVVDGHVALTRMCHLHLLEMHHLG